MRRSLLVPVAAAGVALAALAGIAIAKSFTLEVAKHATVTNFNTHASKGEAIAVDPRGFAVYDLSGETTSHPKCTQANGCFGFWPPVKVSATGKLSSQPGIKGKLGRWHRDGFTQLTLAGHPLYTFSADRHKDSATGQALASFGGTWHVIPASAPNSGSSGSSGGTSTGGMTTSTPSTNPYPPGY